MFPACSLEEARSRLDGAIFKRLVAEWTAVHGLTFEPMRFAFERARFPVGLFFIRGDRAGKGKELAEQVVASFGYWNDDSGKYLDMVFPGWGRDGSAPPFFDKTTFLRFRDEIQAISKWRYSGETDILLLNYVYVIAEQKGDFSFDQAISLPVEVMINDGRVRSLDALVHELVSHAKETWSITDRSRVWEISDGIGVQRGWKAIWDALREWLLPKAADKIYKELRHFAVCDLRP